MFQLLCRGSRGGALPHLISASFDEVRSVAAEEFMQHAPSIRPIPEVGTINLGSLVFRADHPWPPPKR